MGMPASRITDMHACPTLTGVVPHAGGPIPGPWMLIVPIGTLPAAHVTDLRMGVGPPDTIVKGSAIVLMQRRPAGRVAATTAHGGNIVPGFPTVPIGG